MFNGPPQNCSCLEHTRDRRPTSYKVFILLKKYYDNLLSSNAYNDLGADLDVYEGIFSYLYQSMNWARTAGLSLKFFQSA